MSCTFPFHCIATTLLLALSVQEAPLPHQPLRLGRSDFLVVGKTGIVRIVGVQPRERLHRIGREDKVHDQHHAEKGGKDQHHHAAGQGPSSGVVIALFAHRSFLRAP